MDLQESISADLLDGKGRGRGQEAGILHFFDCFSDRKDQSAVDEGEDDI
jgi:hypothetical protein